ncbi:MAG: translation initiation factor 2 alpha subunit (eIF-2alpha) [Glaciecola sp.]|jgi:translation initiation factor 2 alpha subunit (eIF-2alpha)
MSKIQKLLTGKIKGETSAEFKAETNTVVFLYEKMQSVSIPRLSVKGLTGFVSITDALSFKREQLEEVKVVKGLTYRLSIQDEDYRSGESQSEAFISMFFKEDE